MAVRMIDVAPADREWDHGSHPCSIVNRRYLSGFLQVKGAIDTTYGTKGGMPGGIPFIPRIIFLKKKLILKSWDSEGL